MSKEKTKDISREILEFELWQLLEKIFRRKEKSTMEYLVKFFKESGKKCSQVGKIKENMCDFQQDCDVFDFQNLNLLKCEWNKHVHALVDKIESKIVERNFRDCFEKFKFCFAFELEFPHKVYRARDVFKLLYCTKFQVFFRRTKDEILKHKFLYGYKIDRSLKKVFFVFFAPGGNSSFKKTKIFKESTKKSLCEKIDVIDRKILSWRALNKLYKIDKIRFKEANFVPKNDCKKNFSEINRINRGEELRFQDVLCKKDKDQLEGLRLDYKEMAFFSCALFDYVYNPDFKSFFMNEKNLKEYVNETMKKYIIKNFCAFSKEGGSLVFGVNDNHRVIGSNSYSETDFENLKNAVGDWIKKSTWSISKNVSHTSCYELIPCFIDSPWKNSIIIILKVKKNDVYWFNFQGGVLKYYYRDGAKSVVEEDGGKIRDIMEEVLFRSKKNEIEMGKVQKNFFVGFLIGTLITYSNSETLKNEKLKGGIKRTLIEMAYIPSVQSVIENVSGGGNRYFISSIRDHSKKESVDNILICIYNICRSFHMKCGESVWWMIIGAKLALKLKIATNVQIMSFNDDFPIVSDYFKQKKGICVDILKKKMLDGKYFRVIGFILFLKLLFDLEEYNPYSEGIMLLFFLSNAEEPKIPKSLNELPIHIQKILKKIISRTNYKRLIQKFFKNEDGGRLRKIFLQKILNDDVENEKKKKKKDEEKRRKESENCFKELLLEEKKKVGNRKVNKKRRNYKK